MHNLASDLATGLVNPIGSMLGGNMQKPSGLHIAKASLAPLHTRPNRPRISMFLQMAACSEHGN
tara:strand:- start:83 stop:274 length:192 start_codon:yes stop_codon:yes gene_type:complete